jgi:heptosyltransferase-2
MSENAKDIESIAIRLPNWVGDAAMATPALKSMRTGYPGARITCVGKPGILKFLNGLPYFDETIPVRGKGLRQILPLARRLKKQSYALGLILPNSFSSALSFFLGGVRRRTGYALNGRTLMLHRSIRPVMEGRKRRPVPMTRYYMDLALLAGGADTGEKVHLGTEHDLDDAAARFLGRNGLEDVSCLVGLNPGASFGLSKQWTADGFARVVDRVAEDLGGQAILLCGPGEEAIADAILRRTGQRVLDTSRNVIPLDLLKSVVSRLDGLVTTDTGPRHIAAAFDVPCIVVMGPTDPRYTDYPSEHTRVIRIDVDCGPCHKKACDTDHRCMRDIPGDEVFEALKGAMERRGIGGG